MGNRDFMAKHMLINHHMRQHTLPDRKERFAKREDDDWKEDVKFRDEEEENIDFLKEWDELD